MSSACPSKHNRGGNRKPQLSSKRKRQKLYRCRSHQRRRIRDPERASPDTCRAVPAPALPCLTRQMFATNYISTPAFANSSKRGNSFAKHQIWVSRLTYEADPPTCFICVLIGSLNFNSFVVAGLTCSYVAIFVSRHCSAPVLDGSPNLSPIL